MLRVVTFLVVVPLLAIGARAQGDEKKQVEFISKTGTYKLFDGRLVVEVVDGAAGTNYKITRLWGKTASVGLGPTNPSIKMGAAWFIYPESTSKVWAFNGEKLTLHEIIDNGSRIDSKSSDSTVVPAIVKAAPEPVRERLPEEFKKKYPD